MLKNFSKYAGVVQLAVGLLGQFAPAIGPSLLQAHAGGNIFNMLSGAALSYLGFKGTESAQRMGAKGIGGLNVLVGVLGALGINQIAGISLNEGTISILINLAIGIWGLVAGFMRKN